MNNKIFITSTGIILLLVVSICGCFGEEKSKESDIAIIKDAYCDLKGHFQFTIVNLKNENITIDYTWSLNDPMADRPAHKGNGSVITQKLEETTLVFTIPSGLKDYDARFYVMYINLFYKGKSIYKYREQKSGYDWDYSILPPVKYKDEPGHIFITFETFVSKNEKNDFIVQFENVTYNPTNSKIKLKISEFYIRLGEENFEEWLTYDILDSSIDDESPRFFDIDENNIISNYDYYIIPSELIDKFEKKIIKFETACSHVYKGWWWDGDLLQEEDREAIIFINISTKPENPTSLEDLEFNIEVQSKNPIIYTSMELTTCDKDGMGGMGIQLQEVFNYENKYIYSGKIEDAHFKKGAEPSYEKFFYIELKDTDVNERLILYKLEF